MKALGGTRAIPLVWVGLMMAAAFLAVASGDTPRTSKDLALPSRGGHPTSLEGYRKLAQDRDDAIYAPRGDVRIARCEAFLKEHSDRGLPEVLQVQDALLKAYFEKGDAEPARVRALLQTMARD